MSSVVNRDGNRVNISNEMRAFAKDMGFKIKLCKPRHAFTKGKVEALNKFLAWLIPYEDEFETEEELIAILSKINKRYASVYVMKLVFHQYFFPKRKGIPAIIT